MRKGILVVAVVLGMGVGEGLSAQVAEVAEVYLSRLVALHEEGAEPADVELLTALMAEDAVYEHPRFGARIEGRAAIQTAMTGFLGTSRHPRAVRLNTIEGVGVAVLEFDFSIDALQDGAWVTTIRHQVLVLEVREGAIQRVVDHW